MAAPVRFELTHRGVRVHCLTAWPWGNAITLYLFFFNLQIVFLLLFIFYAKTNKKEEETLLYVILRNNNLPICLIPFAITKIIFSFSKKSSSTS